MTGAIMVVAAIASFFLVRGFLQSLNPFTRHIYTPKSGGETDAG